MILAAEVVEASAGRCGVRPGVETAHRASAIASLEMGILIQLGVADPVRALSTPTVSHQLQHSFLHCADAGEKKGAWRKRACGRGLLW